MLSPFTASLLLSASLTLSAAAQDLPIPLTVTNRCSSTIWPAVATQNGTGPSLTGFELSSGATQNLTVGEDWNGRVWARTNCTFNSEGSGHCGTGDCGNNLTCIGTGAPATLAEFNLPAWNNMSFYDISLVDGYNLPLAIQVLWNTNLTSHPPANVSNPSCVASINDLAPKSFSPYSSNSGTGEFLGTNASDPLPFDTSVTSKMLNNWCPDTLEMFVPPTQKRLPFDPCYSACSKYKRDEWCCTGKHDTASKCGHNFYSKQAKKVCPDAYSYAFDDKSSTFAVPRGNGFEVVFCPGGRSTVIQRRIGNGGGRVAPSAAGWQYVALSLATAAVVSGLL